MSQNSKSAQHTPGPWTPVNDEAAKSFETIFQSGGSRVHVSEDGRTLASSMSAARALRCAFPGAVVYARRKVGNRYCWMKAERVARDVERAAIAKTGSSIHPEPADAVALAIEMAPKLGQLLAAARRLATASRNPHRDFSSKAMDAEGAALESLHAAVDAIAKTTGSAS